MKSYAVFLLQWIIWSGYSLADWLSGQDRWVYKAVMFIVFLQLALYIGRLVLNSYVKTSLLTIMSLITYGIAHFLLQTFYPVI